MNIDLHQGCQNRSSPKTQPVYRSSIRNVKPLYHAFSLILRTDNDLWDSTDMEINVIVFICVLAQMKIKHGLHEARRQTKVLRIDAICISQSDIEERNHQVAQMRDIYSMASSVIV